MCHDKTLFTPENAQRVFLFPAAHLQNFHLLRLPIRTLNWRGESIHREHVPQVEGHISEAPESAQLLVCSIQEQFLFLLLLFANSIQKVWVVKSGDLEGAQVGALVGASRRRCG